MAKNVELIVEIDASGQVHVEVQGAKGKACLEYLELLREALGNVESQTLTQEYYEQAEVDTTSRVEQRTRYRKP